MRVLAEKPPIWDRIVAAFPHVDRQPGIIFAWGTRVYMPFGGTLTRELAAHERTHGQRQLKMGLDAWWDRYLADPDFRYAEEAPAHRAEYWAFCRREADRKARAWFLEQVAQRLSGPLYGGVTTLDQARRCILTGAAA